MIEVIGSNIVIDDTWLWRADHDSEGLVYNRSNPVQTGLKVYGDNVTIYGLAVEHALGNQVEWYGENGTVVFF